MNAKHSRYPCPKAKGQPVGQPCQPWRPRKLPVRIFRSLQYHLSYWVRDLLHCIYMYQIVCKYEHQYNSYCFLTSAWKSAFYSFFTLLRQLLHFAKANRSLRLFGIFEVLPKGQRATNELVQTYPKGPDLIWDSRAAITWIYVDIPGYW